MVNYWLMITAEFENVATLQPQGGCDDPSFTYFFKVPFQTSGELTDKETCVALERSVQIPGSKGTANLVQKCKFCEREGTVSLIPGKGKHSPRNSVKLGSIQD
ncbi:unnamed protein product [Linum tenue]|uniref:Uncharacterized protein n=1 Tax=Linum tenue TaxID=586396 RepID=A0AAV0JJK6_9ROSI|nr:unnamed protein product [Linum tenue]